MGDYADRISSKRLFRAFRAQVGYDEVSEAQVRQLEALILDVADSIGPHLDRISATFWQYTNHDLLHLGNVADLVYDFLPKRGEAVDGGVRPVHLNAVELTFLWLGIFLHDIGMYASDAEKEELLQSESYAKHLRLHADRVEAAAQARADGQEVKARRIEDAILAEYYRRVHAGRACDYIRDRLETVVKLEFEGVSLAKDVCKLCLSHHWGVLESNDPLQPDHCVAALERNLPVSRFRVNLQYLACCLRLGDVLDFDKSRTPKSLYDEIDFTEELSVQEWNKHLSIQGWQVTEHHVRFRAECTKPAYFVAVQEFLGWVDDELRECRLLIDEAPAGDEDRYGLHLSPFVDRRLVKMADPRFVAGGFRFGLEYEQILKLLMDRSLYPDPSLLLRELLQNSLDACRYMQALAKEQRMEDKYVPRIRVRDLSQDEEDPRIVFEDNGIGMSMRQVRQYFLRVGRSYYRSREFEAEKERLQEQGIFLDSCSRFGIGFLSCFLGGDLVEVETKTLGSEPVRITIPGPSQYFVIERLGSVEEGVRFRSPESSNDDGPPRYPGTRVTVHLNEQWFKPRSSGQETVVRKTLDRFAANAEIPETIVIESDAGSSVAIPSNRWSDIQVLAAPRRLKTLSLTASFEPPLTKVPFALETFSDRLRGTVIFQVLRDQQGRPAPSTGFLELGELWGELHVKLPKWLRSLWKLAGQPTPEQDSDFRSLAAGSTELQALDKSVQQQIMKLPAGDRRLIGELMSESPRKVYKSWDSHADFWEALAGGSVESLVEAIRRHGFVHHIPFDLEIKSMLALSGILVPAGVLHWDPAKGTSETIEIAPGGTELYADAFGDLAPAPSASRLFVPREDAHELLAAIDTCVLAAADQLILDHGGDEVWADWKQMIITSIHEHRRLQDPM